jgi:hypothetical protein
LEKVQKRQQRWRSARWLSVLVDVGLIIGGVYLRITYAREILNLWKQKSYQGSVDGFELFIASEFSQLSILGEILIICGAFALGLTVGRHQGGVVILLAAAPA